MQEKQIKGFQAVKTAETLKENRYYEIMKYVVARQGKTVNETTGSKQNK